MRESKSFFFESIGHGSRLACPSGNNYYFDFEQKDRKNEFLQKYMKRPSMSLPVFYARTVREEEEEEEGDGKGFSKGF